jgi:ParB/RepB/Spo0J family partition protein
MGKLTRRVKFIAKERRLSIPAEFLHHHGIERGDTLVIGSLREKLYAFPLFAWERYEQLAEQLRQWFPDHEHPILEIVNTGARLRLGSQDRVVLPRSFPFRLEASAKLHWDLVDGILIMEPEHHSLPSGPSLGARAGQASLLDLMAPANGTSARFDRAQASDELVEEISVGRIDWRDRTFAGATTIPGEALVRSIKVEKIRQPLVLREREGGFQVIDGFRRLTAARQLRLRSVPAIVWRGISDDDCRRLKLMEPADEQEQDSSTLQRLQSTLRLHEDQVALKEIEHITGRRKRTLQRYLRVAQDPAIRQAIETGRLSIFKAEEILKAGVDPEHAIAQGWTVKKIREEGRRGGRKRQRRVHGAAPNA